MVINLNERGNRIGESNPKAVLTDHEVELLRTLRDEGFTYGWLAEKFDQSVHAVGRICRMERRNQLPHRTRAMIAA